MDILLCSRDACSGGEMREDSLWLRESISIFGHGVAKLVDSIRLRNFV